MHLNLHNFIASSDKYFDSYGKNIHGVSNTNSRKKILQQIQDRKNETLTFIESFGVSTEELHSAFNEESSLTGTQKERLAKSLYLIANEEGGVDVNQKRLVASFLLSNPLAQSAIAGLDTSSVEKMSISVKNNIYNMRSFDEALTGIEKVNALDNESRLYLGLHKAFCAPDKESLIDAEGIKEHVEELVSKMSLGKKGVELKSNVIEKINTVLGNEDDVDSAFLAEGLTSLIESTKDARVKFESELADKYDADSFNQLKGRLAQLGESVKYDYPQLGKRADKVTGGSNQKLDDFALFTSRDTFANASFGLLHDALDRSQRIEIDAVDYSAQFNEQLKDQGFTLTKRVSMLEKFKSSTLKEDDVLQKHMKKTIVERDELTEDKLTKSGLDNSNESDPSTSIEKEGFASRLASKVMKPKGSSTNVEGFGGDIKSSFDNAVTSEVSEVRNKSGESMLVIDTRKKLVDYMTFNTDATFRATFTKDSFMNSSIHKMAALKAKESGVQSPVISLPTAKGVTEEQKIKFFASMYSELLDAGYEPDDITCSSIKPDGSMFESSLSTLLKAERDKVLEEKSLSQLSDMMDMGGVSDGADKEHLEKMVSKNESDNLSPNELAVGTFEQKLGDSIDESISQSSESDAVNPFTASSEALGDAEEISLKSQKEKEKFDLKGAASRYKQRGNGLK